MPFRGGPVRANLLVRVDCQAYQPTHFTIWLYSYSRSGTLTVSAHQNTTLTPTASNERNLHYKPVRVIKNWSTSFTPHIDNPRHLKTTTSTLWRHMPYLNTHFNGTTFAWREESTAILHILIFLFSGVQENCQWDVWTTLHFTMIQFLCSNIWNKKPSGAVMFTAAVSLGTSQMATTTVSTKDSET